MSLIPLVDLAHLAALLGLRTWHPADADDLAVLADLLARRTLLAEQTPGMLAPSGAGELELDGPSGHAGPHGDF